MRRHPPPPSLLGGGGSEPSPWCSLILKPPLDTVSHRPFNNNCGHFGTQDEPLGSCDRWWTGEKRFPAGTALRCHALRWLEIGSLTSLLIPPISATRLLSVTAAWLRTTNGDVNVGEFEKLCRWAVTHLKRAEHTRGVIIHDINGGGTVTEWRCHQDQLGEWCERDYLERWLTCRPTLYSRWLFSFSNLHKVCWHF